MKTIITFAALAFAFTGFGQQHYQTVSHKQVDFKPADRLEKIEPLESTTLRPIFGDYTIEKYYILSTDTPSKGDLGKLEGSTVRVSKSEFSGEAIESDSIDIYEMEKMTRGDYIYRNFGRGIRAPEPDIPNSLNVYKTGNLDCYGIALLQNGQIALPYKGVLLILKPIK